MQYKLSEICIIVCKKQFRLLVYLIQFTQSCIIAFFCTKTQYHFNILHSQLFISKVCTDCVSKNWVTLMQWEPRLCELTMAFAQKQ